MVLWTIFGPQTSFVLDSYSYAKPFCYVFYFSLLDLLLFKHCKGAYIGAPQPKAEVTIQGYLLVVL